MGTKKTVEDIEKEILEEINKCKKKLIEQLENRNISLYEFRCLILALEFFKDFYLGKDINSDEYAREEGAGLRCWNIVLNIAKEIEDKLRDAGIKIEEQYLKKIIENNTINEMDLGY